MIPELRKRTVRAGERWIYSAGFNISPQRFERGRFDVELDDLRYLLDSGAAVALLTHQGSYDDGSACRLDFLEPHLAAALGRPVVYARGVIDSAAATRSRAINPGQIVMFENTRLDPGEQRNDSDLARRLAQLGDYVAVGGFSKAHRVHASNVGLLAYRPGWATESLLRPVRELEPWSLGTSTDARSIAVLGGVKTEKVTVGLARFVHHYDVVIPGGIVLNAVLAANGISIGDSYLGPRAGDLVEIARRALVSATAKVYIPRQVTIAPSANPVPDAANVVDISDGVPFGWQIVDFRLDDCVLADLGNGGGRALFAGTPARYTAGFRQTTETLLQVLGSSSYRTILLGGDTVAELPWHGERSVGGGAALTYLATGRLAVLDALESVI